MSLPNYLAKIKSAGIYRFVWDKSQVPPQQAETMRLLIGYSEKGPFNTPTYIETVADFKSIYGNTSKRLERRGVYFHRLAEQALTAGPILALNLKPFTSETVNYCKFDGAKASIIKPTTLGVTELYDTNRFWALDADQLPSKIGGDDYFYISSTDVKENSCSFFIRPYTPVSYANMTIRDWYTTQSLEMPEYLELIQDEKIDQFFVEIYVFRGKFDSAICGKNGTLERYFDVNGETISIKSDFVDVFRETADALEYLADDPNSNFIGTYSGCTLPYFKDANGNYISLDLKFNADYNKHKMLMKLNDAELESKESKEELIESLKVVNETISPVYLEGYTYSSIDKNSDIYTECAKQLATKGIRTALTNRVDVDYHYIVDTFDSSFGDKFHTKSELLTIAKEKDNAFAILNFPKMSKFVGHAGCKNSTGVFDITKVSSVFSMPGDSEGASYGAYYTQLTFSDGTVKSVIPSAALVSNLFMEKWGPRQPYYIVAGPTFGRVSYSGMVGPDYNFGRSDLDVLEPMGVNAIIYVPRKGTYINSNQTAKQAPVSGLSKIHIRELVIYLQNEVEHLLQSYQWELNTQSLRDTIKSKADAICENIMNNGGIYAYVNVCDETNNTPEVIDNEMIILDTEIEPARGAGKMVHQLTIHKTGALSSSIK